MPCRFQSFEGIVSKQRRFVAPPLSYAIWFNPTTKEAASRKGDGFLLLL